VEGSNRRRKNRSYTCIAETCVLYSDCELQRDSFTEIMQNHVKSTAENFVNIRLNIFYWRGLFSMEFLFTMYHKALNHTWHFAWSSMRVWSYSWAVSYAICIGHLQHLFFLLKEKIEMTVSDQFIDLTLELFCFYQEIDSTNLQVVVPRGVLRELSKRCV